MLDKQSRDLKQVYTEYEEAKQKKQIEVEIRKGSGNYIHFIAITLAKDKEYKELRALFELYGGNSKLQYAAIIGFVEGADPNKVEEYRALYQIPVNIIARIYAKSSPEGTEVPRFYQIIDRLVVQGEVGEKLIAVMDRLALGKNSWNPYWIGCSAKLDAIISAIENLEKTSSDTEFCQNIIDASSDQDSELYRALNIPRISRVTFWGQFGYERSKSLIAVQETCNVTLR
ncbi:MULTISPECIES: hypothetical protein [Legionella]|uniref:Uncharacterized protein n=1 Tax=Legionella drozanskii LLAP-1 TaxID=1212489 RepID=A0A0W0SXP2_9GAMM|nr:MULTISPECIES: hypothetical protein [Legionella]KTC88029.1 hypothetical protein Ldro_1648 [Legionella drozanskii LLAP-1]PJE07352.1 MAG: hypothetical protein CK430_14145 [Legionella sp.]